MRGRLNFLLIVVVFIGVQPLFAQYVLPEPEPPALFWSPAYTFIMAQAGDEVPVVPGYIRNNRYYLESLRMNKLAKDTYEYGDYDLSAEHAREAIRYTQLSDEYVALQLKIKEANDTIAAAKQRLDWAVSSGAAAYFPTEYGRAQGYYDSSLAARAAEEWDDAIAAARRVISTLADIRVPDKTETDLAAASDSTAPAPAPAAVPAPVPVPDEVFLPAQYTVRPWAESKDCLWNIADRSWAYGDATQWRLLYNANRAKMPDPDNPDLIHPGMVLDIPSIKGEERRGMWNDPR
ncbi:MAG: LysM peptidoglycan-binding domain-containing protein [Treponema sp.]|jgi:hypothetical protein|nr:LysM peptidoglycan-binding domain-containing protein [Treponema sp.]